MHPLYTRHFPSNCRYIGEENWHSHPSGVRQETSGNIYKAVCRKQSRSRTLRRIRVGLNGMTKERLPEKVTSEQSFSWIKWESQAGICGEQLLDTANHTVPCLCWQMPAGKPRNKKWEVRSSENRAWGRVWYNRSKMWAIYTMSCFLAAPFLKIKKKQVKLTQYIQHIIVTHNHCRWYYPEMYEYILLPPSLLPSIFPSFLFETCWAFSTYSTSHFRPAIFQSAQLPNVAMAPILDGANVEHRAL